MLIEGGETVIRKKVGDHGHSQKSERLVRAEGVRAAIFGCSGVRTWRLLLGCLGPTQPDDNGILRWGHPNVRNMQRQHFLSVQEKN